MPTPKDFLRAQAGVLANLPDPISPQVANSLVQVANALPEVPALSLPGGQALGLPQFPGLPGAMGQLPQLPGIQGGIQGPVEFIQSLETGLPAGLPKFGPTVSGGFRTIETPLKPGIPPAGNILGGGYRSI